MSCALKGHFNLLRNNKLRRAFSAQIIRLSFPQGVALGYDDCAPLGRIVAIVRPNRQAHQAEPYLPSPMLNSHQRFRLRAALGWRSK